MGQETALAAVGAALEAADAAAREACGAGLRDAAAAARRRLCASCGGHDEEGTQDPIDGRWRCRLCWEGLLLESALQEWLPPPLGEADALRAELGPFFTHPGRQRWDWLSWGAACLTLLV